MEVDLDLVLLGKAAVMGIVEGLTEFLPISSTGHLILTASLLNFTGEMVKQKPRAASRSVRVRPMKSIKDML